MTDAPARPRRDLVDATGRFLFGATCTQTHRPSLRWHDHDDVCFADAACAPPVTADAASTATATTATIRARLTA